MCRACCFYRRVGCFQRSSAMKGPSLTPPPPLPSWFGPRASTDDPAVAALLDQVAPARTWQDIGGGFNLNIRLDGAATLVLRVHRPWATRGRVAGLRRLRERLQRAGIRVARPVPILGRELARVGGRWAELEEFVPHVQPSPSQESYLRLFEEFLPLAPRPYRDRHRRWLLRLHPRPGRCCPQRDRTASGSEFLSLAVLATRTRCTRASVLLLCCRNGALAGGRGYAAPTRSPRGRFRSPRSRARERRRPSPSAPRP